MALFPSLPETAHLSDVYERFPENVAPIMEFSDAVLRGDGELSVAERELLATYVSALNACTFCYGSHKIFAELFGVEEGLIDALIADAETAPVDEKLRPILNYVRKLNTLPSRLVRADAEAVFAAGWSEQALFEAVQVSGLFNLMNRIIEGTGVNFDYADDPSRHSALGTDPASQAHSYADYGKKFRAR